MTDKLKPCPSHIEYMSNGMGSQSQAMLVLAAKKEIPATILITADTGSENDCLLSDGQRCTAQEFFDNIIQPYSHKHGIGAHFVRVKDKFKNERDGLRSHVKLTEQGSVSFIPVFGFNSKTGKPARMQQSCTERFKIKAIRQKLRDLGATSARGAEGLHVNEVLRRANGEPVEQYDKWFTLTTDVKWLTRYYPLATLRLKRADCEQICRDAGLLWVQHSQCEFCPHQDRQRWMERSPESIERSAAFEAEWGGKWFLTPECVPLKEALKIMSEKNIPEPELDFGCGNGVCGI